MKATERRMASEPALIVPVISSERMAQPRRTATTRIDVGVGRDGGDRRVCE
jgi:hypothetical protein